MRTTPATHVSRALLAAGAVAGVLVATADVHPDRVARITADACVARLPGSAARCDTDRAVDHLGPYLLPGAVGLFAGLTVAVALVLVGRLVVQALRGPDAAPAVETPVGGATRARCAACGTTVTPGVSGTRDAGGRVLCRRCGPGT